MTAAIHRLITKMWKGKNIYFCFGLKFSKISEFFIYFKLESFSLPRQVQDKQFRTNQVTRFKSTQYFPRGDLRAMDDTRVKEECCWAITQRAGPSCGWQNRSHCWEFGLQFYRSLYIQDDQKVSVHLIITVRKLQLIFKVTPASYQSFIDTILTLTPSVNHNSNYVIMVNDWHCLKYFACFCTYIIRCTQTFWSPCVCVCVCVCIHNCIYIYTHRHTHTLVFLLLDNFPGVRNL
jgi:hypothetical protein